MDTPHTEQVINLSNHAAFEKHAGAEKIAGHASDRHEQEGAEFLETLFRLLGEKRHTVVRFVQMKLDKEKRRFFRREMADCRSIKAESRCVKHYIAHLSVKDVRALLMGLPEMAAGKDEALIYPGETLPEKRLAKFARTFGVSDAEMNRCMLFFLLMT